MGEDTTTVGDGAAELEGCRVAAGDGEGTRPEAVVVLGADRGAVRGAVGPVGDGEGGMGDEVDTAGVTPASVTASADPATGEAEVEVLAGGGVTLGAERCAPALASSVGTGGAGVETVGAGKDCSARPQASSRKPALKVSASRNKSRRLPLQAWTVSDPSSADR